MAQISINRLSGYSNKFRKIKLVLDHQEIAELKDGEIKILNVSPGTHTIKAEIDWCQSNEIELTIREGETKELVLKGTNPFFSIVLHNIWKKKLFTIRNAELRRMTNTKKS
ncbi:MAG: hypothetical protein RLZ33_1830 [Bacteroidota bacterium]|jgi:hypothetical protein